MASAVRSCVRALRPLSGRPTRGAVLKDVLLGLFVWIPAALELGMRHWNAGPAAVVLECAAALAAVAVTVALSRPYPLVALLVSVPVSFWAAWFSLLMMVMSYLAGRRTATARPALLAFGAIGAVGVLLTPWAPRAWVGSVSMLMFTIVFLWLVGRYRRQHLELMSAGWERAGQLEREQRIIADQARLRERSRIAHDMHDSLGHELSLIALRAGALEVTPDLDERHRSAVADLRVSATTATDRLREIIGVLRDDSEQVPMEPVGEGVYALVERARNSGLQVILLREGEPAELPPMADRAAYRVVQEALTNATKHAPGAAVVVRLVHGPEETLVSVVNEPPPAGPLPVGARGRRGLIGLRERVRLAGGTFQAGERDGGWAVTALLPVHPEETDTAAAGHAGRTGGEEWSEIADHYRRAQRRVRWGLIALVGFPVAAGALLMAGGLVIMLYQSFVSAMSPEDYASLRVGQDRASVEDVLPPQEHTVPLRDDAPPEPEGAECRHYRSTPDFFDTDADIYRICLSGGELVAKDALPPITASIPDPAP
ncbi:histidine kinase [Spinactinospora alkalitolerans]